LKSKELIILRAIAPIKALQIPHRNRKPGTKKAAKPKIVAFKTKANKPNVKMMKGNAKKNNIGRNMAFKIPNTAAEIMAFLTLSISMPSGSLEMSKKLIVVTIQLIRSPVILIVPLWS
jgi:hypothetical protein